MNVIRFVNQPVPSNAYLVVNNDSHKCFIVDPGSKEDTIMEAYVRTNKLDLDYIFLTHEHFDHVWGVNNLVQKFPNVKVICTKLCKEWVCVPMNYFNKLYFNSEEMYCINKVDLVIENINYELEWKHHKISFIKTPGHTNKGMCIFIDGHLFTGDTLMNGYKPVLKKQYGASIDDLKKSIDLIFSKYDVNTSIHPGHGDVFKLGDVKEFYKEYFEKQSLN